MKLAVTRSADGISRCLHHRGERTREICSKQERQDVVFIVKHQCIKHSDSIRVSYLDGSWNRAVIFVWNEGRGHSGSAATLSVLIWGFINCAIWAAVNTPDSAVSLQQLRQNLTLPSYWFLKMSHRALLGYIQTCQTQINIGQGSAFINLGNTPVFVTEFSFKLMMLMCCIDFRLCSYLSQISRHSMIFSCSSSSVHVSCWAEHKATGSFKINDLNENSLKAELALDSKWLKTLGWGVRGF